MTTVCTLPQSGLRRPALALALGLVAALTLALAAPTAHARTVNRGINDESWVWANASARNRILNELTNDLHVQTVRIFVRWELVEPECGVFDAEYLGALRQGVVAARAHGLQVMVAVFGTPKWASDQSLWSQTLLGHGTPVYHDYYPPSLANLGTWQEAAETLAHTFRGLVSYWECWNEPNLWTYFYPQRTATDKLFAPRRYTAMLRAFYAGIKAGDPNAKVLGGVTSPIGSDDVWRTSPLRFAQALKRFGAAAFMDGCSHHPYAVGGVMPMLVPETPPRHPKTTVNLGNIDALLTIFPTKPFYLTEYAYPTLPLREFGGAYVSQTAQADYLARAYRYAARYPRVKMLCWFLRKDGTGCAMGLRNVAGGKKPSWYAYARLCR